MAVQSLPHHQDRTPLTTKHNAQQIEVRWDKPEALALVVDTTTDGDKIARRKQQQEKDRKESEETQATRS